MTAILICTYQVQDNLFLLYLVGVVVTSAVEYLASLFLEVFFHMKLWDYSHLWGNLQGRIAPQISLFWGLGVVFLVKVVQPFMERIIAWEELRTHGMLAFLIAIVMGSDLILTTISVQHFHTTTKMWNQRINQHLSAAHVDLDNWHDEVVAHLDEIRPRPLSWNHRRLLRSFSQLCFIDSEKFNHIKGDLLKRAKK